MNSQIATMLKECSRRPGATTPELARMKAEVCKSLPDDYLELLAWANGVEGFVDDDAFLLLWPTWEIAELNEEYAVCEFAPGLMLIGTDGANTGYGIDFRDSRPSYVSVPLIGMSHDDVSWLADDLESFLKNLK